MSDTITFTKKEVEEARAQCLKGEAFNHDHGCFWWYHPIQCPDDSIGEHDKACHLCRKLTRFVKGLEE